jgi:hypothetical protein
MIEKTDSPVINFLRQFFEDGKEGKTFLSSLYYKSPLLYAAGFLTVIAVIVSILSIAFIPM